MRVTQHIEQPEKLTQRDSSLFKSSCLFPRLNVRPDLVLTLSKLCPLIANIFSLTLKQFTQHHTLQKMAILWIPLISSHALALTASTSGEIHGSAPYLTFDGGKTKVTNSEELLSITLSNGRKYTFEESDPSFKQDPILLPTPEPKLNTIKTYLPDGVESITLNDLIAKGNWGDDDGDVSASATGNLSMNVKNDIDQTVHLDDVLDSCYSPYKMTLTSEEGKLTTRYGIPTTTEYKGNSAIYKIATTSATPRTCFALPFGDISSPGGFDAPWVGKKGFSPRDIKKPEINFPTTGINNASFNLFITGASANNITYSKSPESSKLSLEITPKANNNAQIVLHGPKDVAQATTFTIYADKAKTQVIYRFKIKDWYVYVAEDKARNVLKSDDNIERYCQSKAGKGYSLRNVSNNSMRNKGGRFRHKIDFTLMGEWGNLEKVIGGSPNILIAHYFADEIPLVGHYRFYNKTNGEVSKGKGENYSNIVCAKTLK